MPALSGRRGGKGWGRGAIIVSGAQCDSVQAKPIDAEILGGATLSSVEFWKSSLSHTGNVRDDVYATVA
jgi:hypothetical protein